jgi:hypothetical protein
MVEGGLKTIRNEPERIQEITLSRTVAPNENSEWAYRDIGFADAFEVSDRNSLK